MDPTVTLTKDGIILMDSDQYSLTDFINRQSVNLFKKTIIFSEFLSGADKKGSLTPYLKNSPIPLNKFS